MPISVVMPALEMAQETGKLIAWLKKEGDRVSKGEPLLEIKTDKAIMEIESPGEGVLGGVKAEAGAEIPVGQTIAWILRPGESVPSDQPKTQSGRHQEKAGSQPAVVMTETATKTVASPRVSPKARRLAKELNVDLTHVRGSGGGGEILASDIQVAAGATEKEEIRTAAQAAAGKLSSIARLMAERTT